MKVCAKKRFAGVSGSISSEDVGVCLSLMGIVDRCAIETHGSSHVRHQSIMIVSGGDPRRA